MPKTRQDTESLKFWIDDTQTDDEGKLVPEMNFGTQPGIIPIWRNIAQTH